MYRFAKVTIYLGFAFIVTIFDIFMLIIDFGMYLPLNDDKHGFVRDNSKKCTGNPR